MSNILYVLEKPDRWAGIRFGVIVIAPNYRACFEWEEVAVRAASVVTRGPQSQTLTNFFTGCVILCNTICCSDSTRLSSRRPCQVTTVISLSVASTLFTFLSERIDAASARTTFGSISPVAADSWILYFAPLT